MRLAVIGGIVALLVCSPVAGQTLVNGVPPGIPTQEDLDSKIAAATPDPCTPPMADTLVASAGSGPRCMPRTDATRATVIQAKTTITATDSTWAVTFDAAFPTIPIYADARVYGASQPYLCTVQTLTTAGASGKCYQLVATTLPTVATSLLGLVVSPVSSAASGLSVRVVARQ